AITCRKADISRMGKFSLVIVIMIGITPYQLVIPRVTHHHTQVVQCTHVILVGFKRGTVIYKRFFLEVVKPQAILFTKRNGFIDRIERLFPLLVVVLEREERLAVVIYEIAEVLLITVEERAGTVKQHPRL